MDVDTTAPFRGSEAVRAGELTWSVLNGPRFRRLEPDTYVASEVPDCPLLRIRAALVRAGPTAVATGWSACLALGLDVAPATMPVEIALCGRQLRPVSGTVVRRLRFAPDEVTTTSDGVATTTAVRTAFDLALRSGPDFRAVDRVIDPLSDALVAADALSRLDGFSADDLSAFAARHPRRRGQRRLRRLVALLDPGAESPPETRARLRLLLAGLPRPVTQYVVPGLPYRLDLAWPEFRVAVEYDGHDHTASDRRARDLDRLDALRRVGWVVIVITAPQLARQHWLAERAREALVSHGWSPTAGPDGDCARIVLENARRS